MGRCKGKLVNTYKGDCQKWQSPYRKRVWQMENNQQIRPLSPAERQFSSDNYHLIREFLKRSRLDAEEFFDIVVFGYLLSVEIYLNNAELQKRCNFEAVSYMYMRRAVFKHFREQKAFKRSPEIGTDISFERIEANVGKSICSMEDLLEYKETIQRIGDILTAEQQRIFCDKLEGYSLKEIAESNGIKPKRVYRQFGKIKSVVAGVMENNSYMDNLKGGNEPWILN